jgi:ATP phosphoribosyltransferase
MLRLALQKSGRLAEQSVELVRDCGIRFSRADGKLRAVADNFPVELLYLRDDDIPGYVADGVAHAGIVGQNVVAESGRSVDVVERLGFGRCRLSIAVPRAGSIEDLSSLDGAHIATSYPRVLAGFLESQGIQATIHEISGSVEIAPGIGLADAICDLVSTGSTLISNGLRELATVMPSEAVLIANRSLDAETSALLDALRFRVGSVLRARGFRYILLNVPDRALDEVKAILPGMKSPTVMPLAESGWSSVHSVIRDDEFWEIIDRLKAVGAEGMLVVPIEKMVQ